MKNYKADPRDRLILKAITRRMGICKDVRPDWKCIGFGFMTV